MASVEGKVIIVTGAARGLGRAYATALASDGARVVAGDIRDSSDTVSEIKSSGGDALAVELNVGDAASCEAMAASALETYGRVDGIINNAALYGGLESSKAEAIAEEDWQSVMDINVSGVWRCCKAVIPHLRANGGGSIINIASLAAVYGMPNALHYATSKAAVIGMTRSMARELGRSWIRVNAIAPSAVMTEGTEEFFGERLEKAKQVIAGGQSLQRNLETEDLVGTVRYLLSDDSKFVTGQTIMVDGGTVFL
ncbi:MAG: glucose 1-dehydrogenase [Hyphomicrobiaceae bacterium TMED74]|nr:dehydrogenase [Filomicrobium sp.]RPG35636.1 MAG: glucose 1-dehydrogenase [Hyphomicrobiaceae bacterium TMED74]